MKNSELPAIPFTPNKPWDNHSASGFAGLTKREYFAGLAMQGLISNPNIEKPKFQGYFEKLEKFSKVAIEYADSLLKELEKEASNG